MSSYTYTNSQTFTATHAKYLASKVAADLKRIQRLYGGISEQEIADYEAELIEYLKKGYLDHVTYGFQKNGNWTEPSLQYTARELASMYASDDDPGKVVAGANITGASFTSFLSHNSSYAALTQEQKTAFKNTLPFQRTPGSQPGINGYLVQDKTYSASGTSLNRSTVKSR